MVTESTVVFLKNTKGEICLARKKQPIHTVSGEISYSLRLYNGYGGKREEGDGTIEDTAIRELFDESSVSARKENLVYLGRTLFSLSKDGVVSPFMLVFFYEISVYEGAPSEGDEMGPPTFFNRSSLPYDEMMPADKILLSRMFAGEKIDAEVTLLGKGVEPEIVFKK